MEIIRFVFSFLFVRDWHTGQMELSRPRLVLFSVMVFIILLGILIALLLQAPVMYSRTL